MSSEYGNKIKVTIFGESHGKAVGAVVDGLPAGVKIDIAALEKFMKRRAGGKKSTTDRSEADIPKLISGVRNEITCGSPVCIIIENTDVKSCDYEKILHTPRPGHADYTAYVKWNGNADMRGGGHFSGRLTAPLCAAGGIALQILADRGIYIGAHLLKAGGVRDESFPLHPNKALFECISEKSLPVIDDGRGIEMSNIIESARNEGDSVGAVIECAVCGLPAGVGEPMFDGVESRLSHLLFGIPAVKGVDFGSGFEGCDKKGSENNDAYIFENGKITSPSNNCGGVLGGITNGMPLVFRVAVKPTPSIRREQKTVDLTDNSEQIITVEGRHDACIGIRAVPAVEAAAALVVLDMLSENN